MTNPDSTEDASAAAVATEPSMLRRAFFATALSILAALAYTCYTLGFVVLRGPALCLSTACAIFRTPRLSRKLKCLALSLLLPLTLALALVALPACAGYGLIIGFVMASAQAELAALLPICRHLHSMLHASRADLLNNLSAFALSPLAEGETVFDLPVTKLGAALLAGSLAGSFFLLLLSGYVWLMSLPALCRWDFLYLSKSTQAVMLRIAVVLISPLCALLFIVLAPLAGAIYGAVYAAQLSYRGNWRACVNELVQTLKHWHRQFMQYLF